MSVVSFMWRSRVTWRIGFPTAAGMGELSRIMALPFQRTCASLLLALACAAPGRAWNAEGHAAVGLVAEQNLTPDRCV